MSQSEGNTKYALPARLPKNASIPIAVVLETGSRPNAMPACPSTSRTFLQHCPVFRQLLPKYCRIFQSSGRALNVEQIQQSPLTIGSGLLGQVGGVAATISATLSA